MHRQSGILVLISSMLSVTACDRSADQDHDYSYDDADLRMEIERLENEIGKLEFRIFELENPGTQGAGAPPEPAPAPQTGSARDDNGRFDLTPEE